MFARADAAEALAPAAAGAVALLSPPAHSCPTEPERGYERNICSTANLDTRLAAKLDRDARVRTLEMQQRGKPAGADRLQHLSFDHNVPIAKALKLGAPNRQAWLATSADTRAVHSVVIVPSTAYANIEPAVKELGTRDAKPVILCSDNAPNNKPEFRRDLGFDAMTLDEGHGLRRVLNEMNPAAQPIFGTIVDGLKKCFRFVDHRIVAGIDSKLQTPGGIKKGGRVMLAPARGGEPADMMLFDGETDCLTAGVVAAMKSNGAYWSTFAANIGHLWHEPATINLELNRIANRIDPAVCICEKLGNGAPGHRRLADGEVVGQTNAACAYDPSYGWTIVRGEWKCAFFSKALGELRALAGHALDFWRPPGAPSYLFLPKVDGRGLPVVARLDSSCLAESEWAVLERTMSASTYELRHGHGLIMACAGRIGLKGDVRRSPRRPPRPAPLLPRSLTARATPLSGRLRAPPLRRLRVGAAGARRRAAAALRHAAPPRHRLGARAPRRAAHVPARR